jgi:SAM-dependent methyltransferase
MKNQNEFDQTYANKQLHRSKNPIRRLIKHFYLNNVLHGVIGSALDLGCGAGQLLVRLPPDSLGLELNPFLIKELTSLGMNVLRYDINEDDCQLSCIHQNQFKTLIISHVLEHFVDAATIMQKLFSSANHLDITRIIIVVPGKLGYASDKTHRTFINKAYIETNNLEFISGYRLISSFHFPIPYESFGNVFIYQELKLIYDKIEKI